MQTRDEILEFFSTGHLRGALYLAGQGHYREPKPLEIQYLRSIRYIDALNEQSEGSVGIAGVFVDLNHPRSTLSDEIGFPEFAHLLDLASGGEISVVFGDLAQYDARLAPFHWVGKALEQHGVPYIDAGLDDGGVVAYNLTQRLGQVGNYNPSDAEDMLAFFPGLSDAIINEFLNEAQRSDPDKGRLAREACDPFRRDLFQEKPYRITRLPTLWVNKRDRLFRERDR